MLSGYLNNFAIYPDYIPKACPYESMDYVYFCFGR